MNLLTFTAFTLLSSSLALAVKEYPRDEWQLDADSLACLYMTSDVDWKGEGQNLCEVSGQCGRHRCQIKCFDAVTDLSSANLLPDGLTKNVSSAGPPNGITCFLYE